MKRARRCRGGMTQPGDEDDRAIDNRLTLTARCQYRSDAVRCAPATSSSPPPTMCRGNQQRLMHRLGPVPPAEAESRYYANRLTDQPVRSQNPEGA